MQKINEGPDPEWSDISIRAGFWHYECSKRFVLAKFKSCIFLKSGLFLVRCTVQAVMTFLQDQECSSFKIRSHYKLPKVFESRLSNRTEISEGKGPRQWIFLSIVMLFSKKRRFQLLLHQKCGRTFSIALIKIKVIHTKRLQIQRPLQKRILLSLYSAIHDQSSFYNQLLD